MQIFLFALLALSVRGFYIRPIVTHGLIKSCRCGFIVPVANCTSVYQSPEMECGMMTIFYSTTTYPECSQAYITCTKQGGASLQSVGIVGKVKDNVSGAEDWSLLINRKISFNQLVLTCKRGLWVKEDLEGNPFTYPLEVQCASSDAADAFDYYITN